MAGRQTNTEKFTKYSNMSLRDIEQRIEELREVVYEKKGKPTEAKYHYCARELQTMLELWWWHMQQRPQHATHWFKPTWMWVHVNCFCNKCLLFQINLLDDNYCQWLLFKKEISFPMTEFLKIQYGGQVLVTLHNCMVLVYIPLLSALHWMS